MKTIRLFSSLLPLDHYNIIINYTDISNKLVSMKLFIHSTRGLSKVVSMMFSIDIPNIFIPPTYPGLRLVHVCDNHFNILTLLHCSNSNSNIYI